VNDVPDDIVENIMACDVIDDYYYDDSTQFDTENEQDTTDMFIEEVWPIMGFPDNWHAWALFALNDLRYDVVEFFHLTYNLNASWIDCWIDYWDWFNPSSEGIIYSVGFRIAQTKITDPALYAEIVESIERESGRLNLDENISSLVNLLFMYIQQHYERDMAFFLDYHYTRQEVIPSEWSDYVDWEISPDSMHRWDWEIQGIRLMFEHDLTEQGVQHVMFMMLYSADIFIPDCPIVIAAAIGEKARDMLIEGLVERITALRDGGFNIYKEYVEILTDPRRVFDPRTREVYEKVTQLIKHLV